MSKTNGRDSKGRFAVGNSGGPGRPSRAVEREYLATIADAVPLEAWREIVASAVEAAKAGDSKARDWLTRHLVGKEPPTLLTVSADEFASEAEGIDLPFMVALARAMTPERRKGVSLIELIDARKALESDSEEVVKS